MSLYSASRETLSLQRVCDPEVRDGRMHWVDQHDVLGLHGGVRRGALRVRGVHADHEPELRHVPEQLQRVHERVGLHVLGRLW